jgi:lipopolysaccharide export system protein LptA
MKGMNVSMKHIKGLLYFSLTIFLIIQGPVDLFGQQKKAKDFGFADSKEPIHVESDELEFLRGEGRAVYSGNVVAKQGVTTMYSDNLTIFFDLEKDEVKKVIAIGHVRFESEGGTATGGRLDFDNLAQTAVLTENPVVIRDKDVIKGSKIKIFLNEDKYVVESEPGQRVKTTIFPKKETEKKKEKKERKKSP